MLNQKIPNRLAAYAKLIRFDKPIGTLLLLWPTLWALWIAADGKPSLSMVLIFTLGTFLMRSAGDIVSDICDRRFDGFVERTKHRPLVTGEVSLTEAYLLFFVFALMSCSLLLFLNRACWYLAAIGMLITLIYPLVKRFSHLPQCVLGVAYSWGIPMAFAAEQGSVPPLGWSLFAVAMIWPVAYDTMYAMVDREDDVLIGVKSTAILFGQFDTGIIAGLQLMVLLGLVAIGLHLGLNLWYYLGLIVAAVLACYQQYLVKNREPARCFKAFLNNHWFGMAVFVGILLSLR